MRVLVTGATGFIGSAVVRELLAAGHGVVGLARSDKSASALTAAGAEVRRGSIEDLDGLRAAAAEAGGVVHLAYDHDFTDMARAAQLDRGAIGAIGSALEGSGKPFVVTSGTSTLPQGVVGTEEDAAVGEVPRGVSEGVALAWAGRGVRVSVVRLSPTVHGEGDVGFVPMVIGVAREKGVSAYVGDGSNRWPAVHRLDAARLFRLVLESGSAGARWHGAAEVVEFREVAEVIGARLGVPVVSVSAEEAVGHFGGWLGVVVGADNPVSSGLTRERLGWGPVEVSLGVDVREGHYFGVRRG